MHKIIEIFADRAALHTEILALRQQVAVLNGKGPGHCFGRRIGLPRGEAERHGDKARAGQPLKEVQGEPG